MTWIKVIDHEIALPQTNKLTKKVLHEEYGGVQPLLQDLRQELHQNDEDCHFKSANTSKTYGK
jgi:hypothetical protein